MGISRRTLLKGAGATAAMNTLTSPFQAFAQSASKPLIVDCHGHYTTEPEALNVFRAAQIASAEGSVEKAFRRRSEDQRRSAARKRAAAAEFPARARHRCDAVFAPRRRHGQSHRHRGDQRGMVRRCPTELIHRIAGLYPDNFIGIRAIAAVARGAGRTIASQNFERCVKTYGFVAGESQSRSVRRLLARPAAVRSLVVSALRKTGRTRRPRDGACQRLGQPEFSWHRRALHHGDTTAFMQFITSDLFKDFPTCA